MGAAGKVRLPYNVAQNWAAFLATRATSTYLAATGTNTGATYSLVYLADM